MAGEDGLETGIRTGLTRSEGRRFGATVGGAFLALAGLLFWRDHVVPAAIAAAIGALLVLGGLAIPDRLGPVHAAWMGLAKLLSKVTTPIFMGVVFFLVITPAGLVMRLFGRNPLEHQPDETGFWVRRDTSEQHSMERQF